MNIISRVYTSASTAIRASFQQIFGAMAAFPGYSAAKINRFTKGRFPFWNTSENAIPTDQFPRLKSDAWQLWRDNPYFRKIVTSTASKVVGTGMTPRSLAMLSTPEGDVPATNFRLRAQQCWKNQAAKIDFAGVPGQGGLTEGGIEIQALTAIMLSGDVLFAIRPISAKEQEERGIPAPITIQLIDSARLPDDIPGGITDGHRYYRGIELDSEGRRVAYWVNELAWNQVVPQQGLNNPKSVSASDLRHVYIKHDVDQLRGTSWFAPVIDQGRDTSDVQQNIRKGTATASCIVGGYSLGAGKTRFGQAGADFDDLKDENGNVITRISSSMLMNLGKDGKFQFFNPNVNLAGYEGFIQHLLRGVAAGLPGVKASTVTGDYRNSSFSSERSAENDVWPEIEILQKWFAESFCQSIYEAVITAAVADGYFDGIVTAAEFNRNKASYLAAEWQGPVQRSINPVDDVQAAALRIKSGLSTPQIEANKLGVRIEDIIHAISDFRQMAQDAGLPEVYVNNVLGFDTQDVLSTNETMASKANDGKGPNVSNN